MKTMMNPLAFGFADDKLREDKNFLRKLVKGMRRDQSLEHYGFLLSDLMYLGVEAKMHSVVKDENTMAELEADSSMPRSGLEGSVSDHVRMALGGLGCCCKIIRP